MGALRFPAAFVEILFVGSALTTRAGEDCDAVSRDIDSTDAVPLENRAETVETNKNALFQRDLVFLSTTHFSAGD